MWQYFFKISKISKFFDFCTNHERSIFAIKISIFFFFKKIRQNLPDFNDFSEFYKKKCSSQNCSRLRPHMVMLFKNWKLAKIRQISSIFHKKIENFEFNFCTYHERSNFGIKISHFFFFVLKILPTFCDYLPFFTTILKES